MMCRSIALLFFLVSSVTFAQTPYSDTPRTSEGRPDKTDKILLKDGSEKAHVQKPTKKAVEKPKPPEEQKSLPTDVE